MRLVVAAAGLLFAAVPASAQYYGPRPVVPIGPPSAYDVAEIVQAMGLDPVGPPARSGPFFVQNARDDFGRVLRVTVDARRSQVIAIESGAPRPSGVHAGYSPHRRSAAYPPFPPDEDFDLAPPGSVMSGGYAQPPHLGPPRTAAAVPNQTMPVQTPHKVAPKPATKAAAAMPMPRKRPAAAPQEAAGSVDPMPAPAASAPAAAPPVQAPAATPPVVPLE